MKNILFWLVFIISGIGRLIGLLLRKTAGITWRLIIFTLVYSILAVTVTAGYLFVLGCYLIVISGTSLRFPWS